MWNDLLAIGLSTFPVGGFLAWCVVIDRKDKRLHEWRMQKERTFYAAHMQQIENQHMEAIKRIERSGIQSIRNFIGGSSD